jgi:MFS family permease
VEGEAAIVRDWPALRRYAIGGALFAAGYVDFALIAFHFQRSGVMSVPAISVSFAAAMAVGALAAPMLGRLFDRIGQPVIGIALAVTALATPLAFLGHGTLAAIGAALWGVGIAVQDALLLALVSTAIARKKATAFGLYDLAFGIAWFAGSVVSGVLLDRSILALVLISTLLQLCAIPFFGAGNKGNRARMATQGR